MGDVKIRGFTDDRFSFFFCENTRVYELRLMVKKNNIGLVNNLYYTNQ